MSSGPMFMLLGKRIDFWNEIMHLFLWVISQVMCSTLIRPLKIRNFPNHAFNGEDEDGSWRSIFNIQEKTKESKEILLFQINNAHLLTCGLRVGEINAETREVKFVICRF
jgi:hypothetical protein